MIKLWVVYSRKGKGVFSVGIGNTGLNNENTIIKEHWTKIIDENVAPESLNANIANRSLKPVLQTICFHFRVGIKPLITYICRTNITYGISYRKRHDG